MANQIAIKWRMETEWAIHNVSEWRAWRLSTHRVWLHKTLALLTKIKRWCGRKYEALKMATEDDKILPALVLGVHPWHLSKSEILETINVRLWNYGTGFQIHFWRYGSVLLFRYFTLKCWTQFRIAQFYVAHQSVNINLNYKISGAFTVTRCLVC